MRQKSGRSEIWKERSSDRTKICTKNFSKLREDMRGCEKILECV